MDDLYLEPSATGHPGNDLESTRNSESGDNYAYVIEDIQSYQHENIAMKSNGNNQNVNSSIINRAGEGTNEKTDGAHYETLNVEKQTGPPKTYKKCNKCPLLIGLISAIIIAGLVGVIIFLLILPSDGDTAEFSSDPSYLTTDTTDSKSYTDVTAGTQLFIHMGSLIIFIIKWRSTRVLVHS